MNEFMTMEVLGTFAGVSLVTGLITQVLKERINIRTQVLALTIAFIIMTGVTLLTTGISDPPAFFLNMINAFVIAGVTSNTAEFIIKTKE